jgi:hypothetical protein
MDKNNKLNYFMDNIFALNDILILPTYIYPIDLCEMYDLNYINKVFDKIIKSDNYFETIFEQSNWNSILIITLDNELTKQYINTLNTFNVCSMIASVTSDFKFVTLDKFKNKNNGSHIALCLSQLGG